MTYKKIAPGLFIPATQTPEVLVLADLEAELAAMQAQAKMQQPTDIELIEFAKMMHPFYNMQPQRIAELQDLINTLKIL